MTSITEPSKFVTPFAESGLKNTIPPASNNTTGKAGFDKGFPERTMLPKASGGIPPSGMDFNGILYDITSAVRYMQSGGRPTYDAAFAAAIGGYPSGAVLIGDDGVSVFQNAVAGNEADPNSGGAGWTRPDLQVMELYSRSYAEAGYNVVGTFQGGFTYVNANDVGINMTTGKGYTGPAGPVAAGTDPASGGFVDRSGVVVTGSISARAFGVVSGVDCAPVIQSLQDLSELLRKPIDFSGIEEIVFSGKVLIGDWFHWKSSGRFGSTIRPLTKSRAALGVGPQGVYAWFGPRDPSVSVQFAMLEDIGFDGGYDEGTHSTPTDRLIMAFCWHAHTGATHRDITALRVHAVDCPHEFWEGYTTGGGQIDGIRMLFCSGDVTDPAVSAVGCNLFKCMNGTIDSPGPYGVYTIRDIVSFGNTCRGWRTLNDFKRGSERWTISACETIDMNDCHHSSDGSRAGTFEVSNKGWQTGVSRATKNYLELQGENIDVMGFNFDADKGGSTKRGQAAVFVTDYEYPANGGDTSGNNRRQSKNINVYSGFAKNVNHSAVRFINTFKCGAGDIFASQCLYGAISVEYVSGRVDTDTAVQILSVKNWIGTVTTESCQWEISATSGADVALRSAPRNGAEGCRADLATGSTYSVLYTPKLLNAANTLLKSSDFWTSGAAAKSDYATPPLGVPYAFELNDANSASIQTYDWGAKIPLSQVVGEYLYINLWVLAGTATTAAVLILEYTSEGALVSTAYKKLTPAGNWAERKLIHKPSTSAVSYVVVKLAPACDDYITPTLTGTTRFADVRISKEPI